MILTTAVAAVATRKRPGSARISIRGGKSRLNSELSMWASSSKGRTVSS